MTEDRDREAGRPRGNRDHSLHHCLPDEKINLVSRWLRPPGSCSFGLVFVIS